MNPAPAIPLAVKSSGLVKRYGDVLAVDGLDLDIPAGQFFGLLGPNGSGKTSTIHMLATLIRPSSGSATVFGNDVVRDAVATRASIGLVFQESALDRTLSIAENLRFAGLLYNLPAKALVMIGLGYSFSGAIVVTIGRVQKVGVLLLVAFAIAIAIALALYLLEVFVVGRRVPEMEPMEQIGRAHV